MAVQKNQQDVPKPIEAILPVTAALLLCCICALTFLTGCKSEQATGIPGASGGQGAMPVPVATAEQKSVPVTGEWVATTDGNVNAQIQPQVSGYIIR